jgi:hypothetical protein
MTLEALGIFVTSLLAAWVVGGVLLRVGGLVLVLVGLSGLALFGQVGGVLTAALGALLWLAGHWHYALRHQRYRSPLARLLFLSLRSRLARSDPRAARAREIGSRRSRSASADGRARDGSCETRRGS